MLLLMDDSKQTRAQKIFSLIRISLIETILAILFTIIISLIALISIYMEELEIVGDVRSMFNTVTENIGTLLDTQLATNVVTLFFWGTIGLIIYSLFWSLFVMLFDIRSDIVVSQYFVHPRSFHKSNFWLAAMSRRVILITAYIVIGLYVILLMRSLPIVYESVRSLFVLGLNDLPNTTLSGLLAFGSWLLGWHLIVVVRRFSLSFTKEA
jgi:hypothetical protein